MKVLKIEDKRCYFSTNGTEYLPITDVTKEDIYAILELIYNCEDYYLDVVDEQTEIANDVELIIYKSIYNQFQTFITNKEVLKNEIDNELKDIIDKYELSNEDNGSDDESNIDNIELKEKIPELV